MDKIQNKGPFIVGVISLIIALGLTLTLLTQGGFLAWIWKPVAIFVTSVVAFYGITEGVYGHRPPR